MLPLAPLVFRRIQSGGCYARAGLILGVGPADADDAGADLHGPQLAVGHELADEALGDGELVGGLGTVRTPTGPLSALGADSAG